MALKLEPCGTPAQIVSQSDVGAMSVTLPPNFNV